MDELLTKIRQLNDILKDSATNPISFNDLTKKLSDILVANTYIVENDGSILAYGISYKYDCDINSEELKNALFPKDFAQKLQSVNDTVSNEYDQRPVCTFGDKAPCIYTDRYLTMIPIVGLGRRLGTFILAKYGGKFNNNDIILCEYASAIVVMELLKYINEEKRKNKEDITAAKMALSTLSFSELEAVKMIFKEIKNEGLIVASKIANDAKITRSVVSNALRKLESAGIIETRSLGMKGTRIKITNTELKAQLNQEMAK